MQLIEYWYGSVPPLAIIVIDPSFTPAQFASCAVTSMTSSQGTPLVMINWQVSIQPDASSTVIVYTPALNDVITNDPSALSIMEPVTFPDTSLQSISYGAIPPETVTSPSPSILPGTVSICRA